MRVRDLVIAGAESHDGHRVRSGGQPIRLRPGKKGRKRPRCASPIQNGKQDRSITKAFDWREKVTLRYLEARGLPKTSRLKTY